MAKTTKADDVTITLPADVWRSLAEILDDFKRFGPGDLSSEYVPDEHVDAALKALTASLLSRTDAVRTKETLP